MSAGGRHEKSFTGQGALAVMGDSFADLEIGEAARGAVGAMVSALGTSCILDTVAVLNSAVTSGL